MQVAHYEMQDIFLLIPSAGIFLTQIKNVDCTFYSHRGQRHASVGDCSEEEGLYRYR